MAEVDDWSKKQLDPLNVFDLANKWSEALKVLGAGNGAGLVAAGAALTTFAKYPAVLVGIKIGGVIFFCGVFAFTLAFASIQLAVFKYDEMLHAIRDSDRDAATRCRETSSKAMIAANRFAVASAAFFMIGLLAALIAFLCF